MGPKGRDRLCAPERVARHHAFRERPDKVRCTGSSLGDAGMLARANIRGHHLRFSRLPRAASGQDHQAADQYLGTDRSSTPPLFIQSTSRLFRSGSHSSCSNSAINCVQAILMDSLHKAVRDRGYSSKLCSELESIAGAADLRAELLQFRKHIARPLQSLVHSFVLERSRGLLTMETGAIRVTYTSSNSRCRLNLHQTLIAKGINHERRTHSLSHRAMPRTPI